MSRLEVLLLVLILLILLKVVFTEAEGSASLWSAPFVVSDDGLRTRMTQSLTPSRT